MSETAEGNAGNSIRATSVLALPAYDATRLASLDLDALIDLLASDEDRVPRAVVEECARRGDAMCDRLAVFVDQDRYWNEEGTQGEWWRLLHAVMILGLIPSERAGLLLVAFMRRMDEAKDGNLQDWLSGSWPALFSNKPETLVPALRELSHDRSVYWYMRIQAIETVIAVAERSGAEVLDAALDWAASIAADESEDWTLRLSTGCQLLDLPRPRHRPLLDALVDRQSQTEKHFAKEEVTEAYARHEDAPQWRRFDDPWRFYQPDVIAGRQERWAQEDAEEDAADEDDLFEEYATPYVRPTIKVGRNDPCPCGSGKKYKKCCLAKAHG
jgi:hypothetical protein